MTKENNIPPFNLECALAGAPVVMRNGTIIKKVIYEEYANEQNQPVFAIDENYELTRHNLTGEFFTNKEESVCDLFMVHKTKTYWTNVYKSQDIYTTGDVFDTLEEAENCQSDGFVKTISFEMEI